MNRSDRTQFHADMTVADIRDTGGADCVDVVFLESARFYRLMRDNPNFERALRLLTEAASETGALRISFDSEDSDLIDDVAEPSS